MPLYWRGTVVFFFFLLCTMGLNTREHGLRWERILEACHANDGEEPAGWALLESTLDFLKHNHILTAHSSDFVHVQIWLYIYTQRFCVQRAFQLFVENVHYEKKRNQLCMLSEVICIGVDLTFPFHFPWAFWKILWFNVLVFKYPQKTKAKVWRDNKISENLYYNKWKMEQKKKCTLLLTLEQSNMEMLTYLVMHSQC